MWTDRLRGGVLGQRVGPLLGTLLWGLAGVSVLAAPPSVVVSPPATQPVRELGVPVYVSLAPLQEWQSHARSKMTGRPAPAVPEVTVDSDMLPANPLVASALGKIPEIAVFFQAKTVDQPLDAKRLTVALAALNPTNGPAVGVADCYRLAHAVAVIYGERFAGPVYSRLVNDIAVNLQNNPQHPDRERYRDMLRRISRPVMYVVKDNALAQKLFLTLAELEQKGSFEQRQALFNYAEASLYARQPEECLRMLQDIDAREWVGISVNEKADIAFGIALSLDRLKRHPEARPYYTRAAMIEGEAFCDEAKYQYLLYMIEDGKRQDAYEQYKKWKPKLGGAHWPLAALFDKEEAEEREER
jgi:hypothetical protein